VSAPLTESEAVRIISRTYAQLEGGNNLDTEILTSNGGPSKGSRNVDVALLQGRINPKQADRFRHDYETRDYELVTQALLALPPKREAAPARSATAFGEAAEMDYLRRTGAVREWAGYSRLVV
jgi:hypothetical protein